MKSDFEVAQDVIARGNARLAQKKKRTKAVLCCACIGAAAMLCAAFIAANSRAPQREAAPTASDSAVTLPAEDATTGLSAQTEITGRDGENVAMLPMLPDTDGPELKMLTLIRTPETPYTGKYYPPDRGQHVVTYPLRDAIRAHEGEEDVSYYLRLEALSVFSDTTTPQQQEAFYLQESERMRDDRVVFSVETFRDADGAERVTFSAVLYDPSFLDDFPDNPDCAYFISLYDEESCIK